MRCLSIRLCSLDGRLLDQVEVMKTETTRLEYNNNELEKVCRQVRAYGEEILVTRTILNVCFLLVGLERAEERRWWNVSYTIFL